MREMGEKTAVLLFHGQAPGTHLLFERPREIIQAWALEEVRPALERIEAAQKAGWSLAGYLTYEAGLAFEQKLARNPPLGLSGPLLWFGVFTSPRELDEGAVNDWLRREANERSAPTVSNLTFDTDQIGYDAAFAAIGDHLACGDIYQVNFTMRASFQLRGAPEAMMMKLLRRQPVGHGAFLRHDGKSVLSLSPELFVERQGRRLRSKPMKGTAPRGANPEEDRALAENLALDPKSRAENVMIVDLLRNDLSRVCVPGSVKVPHLFSVETYNTLFQMTSTVEGDLAEEVGFADAMAQLFPCGSITGAPKLRAMEIIQQLEVSPRGLYTGSIGHISPNGDFRFNVAIRTLVVDEKGRGEVGAGSGVVFDSGNHAEYEECKLKLQFLTQETEPFALIETLAHDPQMGFLLWERHLARLAHSARAFGFNFDRNAVEQALRARASSYETAMRVRLELTADGAVEITDAPLSPTPTLWKIALSPEKMDPEDILLRHKTTRREFLDAARMRMMESAGVDEVIFENANGFLTEGSYTSLFGQFNGVLLTPALRHGLLPGTLRAALLETGRAAEADLTLDDLQNAEAIFMGNSVRGLIRAELTSR